MGHNITFHSWSMLIAIHINNVDNLYTISFGLIMIDNIPITSHIGHNNTNKNIDTNISNILFIILYVIKLNLSLFSV